MSSEKRDGINYGWLTITDPESGEERKETKRERKNRIDRERRALKRKGLESAMPDPEPDPDREVEPDDEAEPVKNVEPPSTERSPAPAPSARLPRFAWKRPGSMGYTLHQMLLAGCTRADIRRCASNPAHPFHGKDVWSLLVTYLRGTWNSGTHLMDPDLDGGIKEKWHVVAIGEAGTDDELLELRVAQSALTPEDRRLLMSS